MITIAQAGGAGAGSPSLDHAWLDVPIQITGSASVTVLDKTDGMTVTVAGVASAHTVTLSGGPGAARLGLVDTGTSVVRVIGATHDASGVDLCNGLDAPPCYQERPGERNGSRSYASAYDLFWQRLISLSEPQAWPDALHGATLDPLPQNPRTIAINGQSNAVASPPFQWGLSFLTRHLSARLRGWSYADQAWVALRDQGANMRNTDGGVNEDGDSGPGAGQVMTPVLRAIADRIPGLDVYAIALAYSGQGIDYFLPASATPAYFNDGAQHGSLNNYNLMSQEIEASGRSLDLYVWIQGEANAGESQAVHYAKLVTLFGALTLANPGCHFVIVGTLHASGGADGVFAAQQQIANENPHIHLIDNRDMQVHTAWWGGQIGQHYTPAGYKEVAARIDALLLGADARPNVAAVAHIDDVSTWSHRWGQVHSCTAAADHNLAVWQDTSTLGPSGVKSLGGGTVNGSTAPTHVPYDPAFGNASVVELDGIADGLYADIDEADSTWSCFMVAKPIEPKPAVGYAIAAFDLAGPDAGDRWHLYASSPDGTQDWMLSDGATSHLSAIPYDAGSVHTYGFVLTPTETRGYRDGVLVFTGGPLALAGPSAPRIYIGHVLGTGFWQARIASISLGNANLNDAEMAACHAWAEVEFDL